MMEMGMAGIRMRMSEIQIMDESSLLLYLSPAGVGNARTNNQNFAAICTTENARIPHNSLENVQIRGDGNGAQAEARRWRWGRGWN